MGHRTNISIHPYDGLFVQTAETGFPSKCSITCHIWHISCSSPAVITLTGESDKSYLAYFTLISYLDRRVSYVVLGVAMKGQVPLLGKSHATQLTGIGFLLLVLTQHMPGKT